MGGLGHQSSKWDSGREEGEWSTVPHGQFSSQGTASHAASFLPVPLGSIWQCPKKEVPLVNPIPSWACLPWQTGSKLEGEWWMGSFTEPQPSSSNPGTQQGFMKAFLAIPFPSWSHSVLVYRLQKGRSKVGVGVLGALPHSSKEERSWASWKHLSAFHGGWAPRGKE